MNPGVLLVLVSFLLFGGQCLLTPFFCWRILRKNYFKSAFSKWGGAWLSLFLVIVPILLLVLATIAFPSGYQTEKGLSWVAYLNEGWAGAATIPLFLAASWVVLKSIFDAGYRQSSRTVYLALITLIAITVWYTYATLVLQLTDTEMGEMEVLAVCPALAGLNYFLYLCLIGLSRRDPYGPRVFSRWMSGIAATITLKIILGIRLRAALPAESPPGYGDCFVVSAAVRGHSWFVGSRSIAKQGGMINNQLIHFRRFEQFLASRYPLFHQKLRGHYNRIGPLLARRIRHPYQADIMYLCLKPLEYVARMILFLQGAYEQ